MKLGILVNTDKHLKDIIGITRSALSKGHTVIIFCMDEGTRLLGDPSFSSLCSEKGVEISYCDYSAKNFGVPTEGLHSGITCGSQFDNAFMNHKADRVIVF